MTLSNGKDPDADRQSFSLLRSLSRLGSSAKKTIARPFRSRVSVNRFDVDQLSETSSSNEEERVFIGSDSDSCHEAAGAGSTMFKSGSSSHLLELTLLCMVDLPNLPIKESNGYVLEVAVGECGERFSLKRRLGGWASYRAGGDACSFPGGGIFFPDLSRAPLFGVDIDFLKTPEISCRLSAGGRLLGEAIIPCRTEGVVSVGLNTGRLASLTFSVSLGTSQICTSALIPSFLHALLSATPGLPTESLLVDFLGVNDISLVSNFLGALPLSGPHGLLATLATGEGLLRSVLDCLATQPNLSIYSRARLIRGISGGSCEDALTVERLFCGSEDSNELMRILESGGTNRGLAKLVFSGISDKVCQNRILSKIADKCSNQLHVLIDSEGLPPGFHLLAASIGRPVLIASSPSAERGIVKNFNRRVHDLKSVQPLVVYSKMTTDGFAPDLDMHRALYARNPIIYIGRDTEIAEKLTGVLGIFLLGNMCQYRSTAGVLGECMRLGVDVSDSGRLLGRLRRAIAAERMRCRSSEDLRRMDDFARDFTNEVKGLGEEKEDLNTRKCSTRVFRLMHVPQLFPNDVPTVSENEEFQNIQNFTYLPQED